MTCRSITAWCATATDRFRYHQDATDAFAMELFRRAICERDELAWEALYTQYRGLVRAWLCRHPAWPSIGDDCEEWVNCVFERFWSAITPERFGSFPSLAALLRYLKLCTHSVLLDELRARHGQQTKSPSEEIVATGIGDAEHMVTEGAASAALWAAIDAEVKDDAERLVAHLSLALELKPQEVYARHPERFASVTQVYTVKRNLLDRLRRNPTIRQFLD
jgi:hypothetical protein